jgi:hypothetical protein
MGVALKEQRIDIPLIEVTQEYNGFKTLEGNRKISETHVKNLADFISRRNLLMYNPILVNENFEVVDGQHRLEAAKQLGIPIYYIIGEGLSYKDVGILNACSDDWEFQEYLNNYVANGQEEYIRLDHFKTRHNLKLKRIQFIMSPDQKRIFDECFKIGTFVIIDDFEEYSSNIKKIDEIIAFIEPLLNQENISYIYTDNFWKALWTFLVKKDADVARFKEKIVMRFQSIVRLGGWKDYLKLFTDIYNYKAKKKL